MADEGAALVPWAGLICAAYDATLLLQIGMRGAESSSLGEKFLLAVLDTTAWVPNRDTISDHCPHEDCVACEHTEGDL